VKRRGQLGTLVPLLALAGCHGGGGEPAAPARSAGWSFPPPVAEAAPPGATMDGRFRDTGVQGLDYDAGAPLVGVTGPGGTFQYSQGESVSFRVGAVPLGGRLGDAVMTPLSLAPPSPAITREGDNRLRFLQMLDVDGDLENGILISDAVRALALGWGAVDFAADYAAFAAAIAPLVAAANAADGTQAHAVPGELAARQHFARGFHCTYNGLYRGTFVGADRGVIAFAVYGTGHIFGGAYSARDRGFALRQSGEIALADVPTFQAARDAGAVFTGDFRGPALIAGAWIDLPATGTFGATRVGGSEAARYRIVGVAEPATGTPLMVSLDVDVGNAVSGAILDRDFAGTGEPVPVTGALNGGALAAEGGRFAIAATFDAAAPPDGRGLVGTVHDAAKNRDVAVALPACRLN
jgi:hypothetical protein